MRTKKNQRKYHSRSPRLALQHKLWFVYVTRRHTCHDTSSCNGAKNYFYSYKCKNLKHSQEEEIVETKMTNKDLGKNGSYIKVFLICPFQFQLLHFPLASKEIANATITSKLRIRYRQTSHGVNCRIAILLPQPPGKRQSTKRLNKRTKHPQPRQVKAPSKMHWIKRYGSFERKHHPSLMQIAMSLLEWRWSRSL